MPVLIDPDAVEVKILRNVTSNLQLLAEAGKVCEAIIERRTKAGEKNPAIVPVVCRQTSEVRWFNLRDRRSSSVFQEAMVHGIWRVATKAEEEAAMAEQVEAKLDAAKRIAGYDRASATRLAQSMAFQEAVDIIEGSKAPVEPPAKPTNKAVKAKE
jgi:hypothetical protein